MILFIFKWFVIFENASVAFDYLVEHELEDNLWKK